MQELVLIGIFLAGVIIILVVIVASDYMKRRLAVSSGYYEQRLAEMEKRLTELELENVRLQELLDSYAADVLPHKLPESEKSGG